MASPNQLKGDQAVPKEALKSSPPEQNFTPRSVKRLEAIRKDAPSLVRLFDRAMAGKCCPRTAIKAQCLDCQGLDREGVRNCGDRACPLWKFRPFQPKGQHQLLERPSL